MEINKRPVFGTREWAKHNLNFMDGCQHDCKYCYAKASAIQNGKRTAENWTDPEIRQHIIEKQIGKNKREGTTMFPTQHDLHPDNVIEAIMVLDNLICKGKNDVLIVSKPHVPVIWEICKHFKNFQDKILFRFTIGSADDLTLRFWEPNAPGFEERLVSLMIAYMMGYNTSVSCEPMLDDNIQAVVDEVSPYIIDAIWLGKANFLLDRLKKNNQFDEETKIVAMKLLRWQNDDNNIIKLYEQYKDNPLIKWKESIKKIVGLEIPTEDGLDM